MPLEKWKYRFQCGCFILTESWLKLYLNIQILKLNFIIQEIIIILFKIFPTNYNLLSNSHSPVAFKSVSKYGKNRHF